MKTVPLTFIITNYLFITPIEMDEQKLLFGTDITTVILIAVMVD